MCIVPLGEKYPLGFPLVISTVQCTVLLGANAMWIRDTRDTLSDEFSPVKLCRLSVSCISCHGVPRWCLSAGPVLKKPHIGIVHYMRKTNPDVSCSVSLFEETFMASAIAGQKGPSELLRSSWDCLRPSHIKSHSLHPFHDDPSVCSCVCPCVTARLR